MYDGFLVVRDLVGEWENKSKQISTVTYHLREARDLNGVLEDEILCLRGDVEEEKKRTDTTNSKAAAAIDRCDRTMKIFEDFRDASEVREDGLNKIINEL